MSAKSSTVFSKARLTLAEGRARPSVLGRDADFLAFSRPSPSQREKVISGTRVNSQIADPVRKIFLTAK